MVNNIIIGLFIIGHGLCCKLYFLKSGQIPNLVYYDKDTLRYSIVERKIPNVAVGLKNTASCANIPRLPDMPLNEQILRCTHVFEKELKVPLTSTYDGCTYYVVLMLPQIQYQMAVMTLIKTENIKQYSTEPNVCEYVIEIDWTTRSSYYANITERYVPNEPPQSTAIINTSTSPTPQGSYLVKEYLCVAENGTEKDNNVIIYKAIEQEYAIKMEIYLGRLGDITIKCKSPGETTHMNLNVIKERSARIVIEELYYTSYMNLPYNLTCGKGTYQHWVLENEINEIVAIITDNKGVLKDKMVLDTEFDKFKLYCIEFKCNFPSDLTAACTEEIIKQINLHLVKEDSNGDNILETNQKSKGAARAVVEGHLIFIIIGVCLLALAVVAVIVWRRCRTKQPEHRPRLPTPPPERRPNMEPYYSVAREGLTRFGQRELLRTVYEQRDHFH